eukprot:7600967-Pyramimonas_sp.AAC.1
MLGFSVLRAPRISPQDGTQGLQEEPKRPQEGPKKGKHELTVGALHPKMILYIVSRPQKAPKRPPIRH